MTILRLFLPGLFLGLALAASAAPEPKRAANLVILDESAVKNLRLETVEAAEEDLEESIFTLGRIREAPGNKAVVSSRVPGRALTVSAHIDTRIEKGAEAILIESRQPGDPPPTVRLLAPLSGFVSVVNVAPGQPVDVADSLIEIVDLSHVHAIAALPEHLASRVRIGQKARIRATGYPDKEFVSEIEHLGTDADMESGTIEVAFHVENPEAILRPGMRAEFSIVTGKREGVLCIPREAVQGDGAQRFVYVADFEIKNAFVKTPVVLGAQNDRMIEVISGVLPGDLVVTRGAYGLGFAGKGSVSLKEALDAAHGHAHNEDGSEMTSEQKQASAAGGENAGAAGTAFTPLTWFFAGTSIVLLILLLALGASQRRHSA